LTKTYSKNCCNKHSTGSREASRDSQKFKTCFFRSILSRFQKRSFTLYEPLAVSPIIPPRQWFTCATARVGDCSMVTCLSPIASPQLLFTDEEVSPLSSIHSLVHANFAHVGNISSMFPQHSPNLPNCRIFNTLTRSNILKLHHHKPLHPKTILSKQTLCIHSLRYPRLV
jgi:hypothetical protein